MEITIAYKNRLRKVNKNIFFNIKSPILKRIDQFKNKFEFAKDGGQKL